MIRSEGAAGKSAARPNLPVPHDPMPDPVRQRPEGTVFICAICRHVILARSPGLGQNEPKVGEAEGISEALVEHREQDGYPFFGWG